MSALLAQLFPTSVGTELRLLVLGGTRRSDRGTPPRPPGSCPRRLLRASPLAPLDAWLERAIAGVQAVLATLARLALVLSLATALYLLPVWGPTLHAPLTLLPDVAEEVASPRGPFVEAEVPLAWWAASLPALTVVDIDLELRLPHAHLQNMTSRLAVAALRVDLELGGDARWSKNVVLPYLFGYARQVRELLLAVPVGLGLMYDEHVLHVPLAGAVSQEVLGGFAGNAASARLRVSPPLTFRVATASFRPRLGGSIGLLLTRWIFFVPVLALALFWMLFGERRSKAIATSMRSLSFVESQMLIKALAFGATCEGAAADVPAHLAGLLAAFEREDQREHGGRQTGFVPLRSLPSIAANTLEEWRHGLEEAAVTRAVAETLELKGSKDGLVTPDGDLNYRLWLAVASVAVLCGGHELSIYADCATRYRREMLTAHAAALQLK